MDGIKSALVLAPHTDDGELGCGGTIARLVESGCDVSYWAFSRCAESLPLGYWPDTLVEEMQKATDILGLESSRVSIEDFPVRRLSEHRQDILERMFFRQAIDYDVVFIPSSQDMHQDHAVIHAEAVRAFRNTSILGYEFPRNTLSFPTQAFVRLEARHVRQKQAAAAEYKTQEELGRLYITNEHIEALAHVRGVQIGTHYAEAFEVIRWIL